MSPLVGWISKSVASSLHKNDVGFWPGTWSSGSVAHICSWNCCPWRAYRASAVVQIIGASLTLLMKTWNSTTVHAKDGSQIVTLNQLVPTIELLGASAY